MSRPYSKPTLYRLDNNCKAAADCLTGSGDSDRCSTGSATTGQCSSSGNYASTTCMPSGNTAGSCLSGSDDS